ncbi:MAG: S8 family peptidase [Myxococcales bacterium]|nr:S8 family peptidase [Myxococcales bacterium]
MRATKDLNVESLEALKSGIRLLSVIEEDDLVRANVAFPTGKLRIFENKIDAYLDPTKVSKEGHPRHALLLNAIERIGRATLVSLWSDPNEPAPLTEAGPLWWEVWARSGAGFRSHAEALGFKVADRALSFPEREVFLCQAPVTTMAEAVELLDSVAELRRARRIETRFFVSLPAREQAAWMEDLTSRTSPPADDAPAVCLLDTGVDESHPLLRRIVDTRLTLEPGWGPDDLVGHGTQMAGFAVYTDALAEVLASTTPMSGTHWVESVKILNAAATEPPEHPDLYGEVTRECVARAEVARPARSRVVTSTITGVRCPDGQPTSWSAAVDGLASGDQDDEDVRRLVVVAVGNSDRSSGYAYPDANFDEPVQDPSQAWNALTVGAYTELVEIDQAEHPDWRAVAEAGDLSPASTTAASWPFDVAARKPPIKPDILVEGGNMAWRPGSSEPDFVDDLLLLTTRRRDSGFGLLTSSGETSGATAIASGVAAQVMARYPTLWPEAVRALMVHSARWTAQMERRCRCETNRATARSLYRRYGYGVLSPSRALTSLAHAPTLVMQKWIQPYDWHESRPSDTRTRDLHLYELPWPVDVLESLGGANVKLRVTLSYFVEPGPGERGWGNRYGYPSFGLRFKVCPARVDKEIFHRAVNREQAGAGGGASDSDSAQWRLGAECFSGSVHSDVWEGTAADLAAKNVLAVYPVYGWWRYRKHLGRVTSKARYALVVSLEAPSIATAIDGSQIKPDLYTFIEHEVGVVSMDATPQG